MERASVRKAGVRRRPASGQEAVLRQNAGAHRGEPFHVMPHPDLIEDLIVVPRCRGVRQDLADEPVDHLAPPEPQLAPVDAVVVANEFDLVHEVGALGVGAALDAGEHGHVGVEPVDVLDVLLLLSDSQGP
eukprot:UN3219